MNRLRPFLPYLALGLFLCGVVFLAWSFFYTALVEPAARILWLFISLARAVDQETVWTLLILAVVIAGLQSLSGSGREGLRPHDPGGEKRGGRAAFWEAQFRSADVDASHRPALQRSLEQLAGAVDELVESETRPDVHLPAPKNGPAWYLVREARRIRGAVSAAGGPAARLFGGSARSKRERFIDRELERELERSLSLLESLMERQNDGLPGGTRDG